MFSFWGLSFSPKDQWEIRTSERFQACLHTAKAWVNSPHPPYWYFRPFHQVQLVLQSVHGELSLWGGNRMFLLVVKASGVFVALSHRWTQHCLSRGFCRLSVLNVTHHVTLELRSIHVQILAQANKVNLRHHDTSIHLRRFHKFLSLLSHSLLWGTAWSRALAVKEQALWNKFSLWALDFGLF